MSVETPDRPGRETRLLALVVIVAIAVLVLLSRFRFPSTGLTSGPPATGPLAGLAARATFDDMAAALTSVLARVAPTLVAVEIGSPAQTAPAGAKPAAPPMPAKPASAPVPAAVSRDRGREPPLYSALRVRRDLAVVYAAGGGRPGLAPGSAATLEATAVDVEREVGLLRLAPSDDFTSLSTAHQSFDGFSYVAVIEATRNGPTVRPRFIGRVNAVIDPRWSVPLLSIGEPTDIKPGTWLFRLDGGVIGLAVAGPDGVAIAPPSALDAIVRETPVGGAAS
jgi:hypothetical protein